MLARTYCACTACAVSLALTARAMYLFCPRAYYTSVLSCFHVRTVLVPLAQCGIDSTGNAPILPACVFYMSACTCTYVLCLYRLYSVLTWTARTMYLSFLCLCLHVRTVLVLLHSVYCASTPCTVFWHGQRGQCTYFARACTCTYVLVLCLKPLHSVYCACTPCTVFWRGQRGRCTYLARACACTYVPCLYPCTVFWYGQPGQCTYIARLRELLDRAMIIVFGLARCTCSATRTVFDMDSLNIWHKQPW